MWNRACWILCTITAFVAASSLTAASESGPRNLSFDERVAAQAAIERVYHAHRTDTTSPFEEAAPRAVLEGKVRKYLAKSVALEHYWQRPVTAEMLEREVDRMVRQSKMPKRLAELFDALGNDPILIQECLARPTLVNRLVASYFRSDERIHADKRHEAEQLHRDLLSEVIDPGLPHPYRILIGDHGLVTDMGAGPPEGEIGPLREERAAFVIDVPLSSDEKEAGIARFSVLKRTFDSWLDGFSTSSAAASVTSVAHSDLAATRARLAVATTGDPTGCATGAWRPIARTTPPGRSGAQAVWTGSEMLVWGGSSEYPSTGECYDPATDTWTTISPVSSVNPPAGPVGRSVVWTGDEMIVWGAYYYYQADETVFLPGGARYDPLADTWTAVSTEGAPVHRTEQTTIWTGEEMIVWGGRIYDGREYLTSDTEGNPYFDTGARYSPVTDSWSPISTTDAPFRRGSHTAVWSGGAMIVWGGRTFNPPDTSYTYLDDGARYSPATDSWSTIGTTDAPTARKGPTAVWTGDEMIVWGGRTDSDYLNSGARYDPTTNDWSTMSMFLAPQARLGHTATWTGDQMIVWGGYGEDDRVAGGGLYDPATNQWQSVSTTDSPGMRDDHVAVWTGDEMIVWGGASDDVPLNSGGRYDPSTDSWVPTAATSDIAPVSQEPPWTKDAVWTGAEMIVWVGTGDSGRYDPVSDSWSPISKRDQPSLRWGQAAVWTGAEMIVWGGHAHSRHVNTGGRYNPNTDSWIATSLANAPELGDPAATVWTGTEMIVCCSNEIGHSTGGRYNPATDTWTATSTTNAPPSALDRPAVWTGSEMIVWGGIGIEDNEYGYLLTGGRYSPATDTWAPTATADAPPGRRSPTLVWTGTEMIVWGGRHDEPIAEPENRGTGGRYNPVTDSWTRTSVVDVPTWRHYHSAVWSGEEMIVWGGRKWDYSEEGYFSYGEPLRSGGHYDPQSDTWWPTSTIDPPSRRAGHAAFWTGEEMLVWGGDGDIQINVSTGSLYGPSTDLDEDGYCSPADCDESDPSIHNGATEINDGIDNQCPGDLGFGAVDEISGAMTCAGDGWFSWVPQEGATLYQLARSSVPDFSTDCVTQTTTSTSYDTSSDPDPASCWYYLVRALAPNEGSWGLNTEGDERTVACE